MKTDIIDTEKISLLSLMKANYRLQYVQDDDLLEFLSYSHFRKFRKGSYIFMEGEDVESLYIVSSGKIELNMNNHKFQEKIFSIIGPGQLLGLSEIFNCHQIHTTNALCEKDCTVAVVSREKFRSIITTLPSLSFAICIIMGNMIGELRHELSLSSAEAKIMSYLKNLMNNSLTTIDGHIQIPREVRYDKLAKILNITRETTSRVFKTLKDRKIIDIHKDYYIILDEEKIRGIVPHYSCLSQSYN
ncbi:MAG: Crp/Fnr family transcriptional regulator [Spirochaetes bacterium]|jgi:CRP/FNR family cyclic AMP-dependent transcriptional regulator|nr:Crp/Fnr family transcriptional regulator [Spirochaetota bacterium]